MKYKPTNSSYTGYCPRCGNALTVEMDFCPKCGLKLNRDSLENSELPGGIEDPEWRPPFRKVNRGKSSVVQKTASEASVEGNFVRPEAEIRNEVAKNGVDFHKDLPFAVQRILANRGYYVVRYKLLEEREADYGGLLEETGLDPKLVSILQAIGTNKLYRFQEEAIHSILKGKNVVIAAPTGNGKTLAFALPIFHMVLAKEPDERTKRTSSTTRNMPKALLVYPTKALARDQMRILEQIAKPAGILLAVFDGDTSADDRKKIFSSPPDILISNFDTIEYHLRNQTEFVSILLSKIKCVVVDELHTYIGAFGSHVYFILRRLGRICRNPALQLVGSSATVVNPKQFADLLFNSNGVTEIVCKNGRRGRIHFAMLYPTKSSMTSLITGTAKTLLSSGMKTLVFANTHKNAEVLNLALRADGVRSDVHRAGLLKSVRLGVEDSFKSGALKCLVATPTLELGLDIGDLDSVVSMLTGITNLTQRMGRAGRKGQESVVVLALRGEDPISAFYRNHPDTYFTDISPAYVEPRNSVVARLELVASAMDRPLLSEEFPDFADTIKQLEKEGLFQERMSRLVATPKGMREVSRMNIRGIGETVSILLEDRGGQTTLAESKKLDVLAAYTEVKRDVVATKRSIGERQMPMAMRELFPGAVYLLGGKHYGSTSFEFKGSVGWARVRQLKDRYPYKTEALRHSEPKILGVLEKKVAVEGAIEVLYCSLQMTEVVDGYILKEIFSDKKVGGINSLPEPLTYSYETKGFVFKAPRPKLVLSSSQTNLEGTRVAENQEDIKNTKLAGSFHALEHALIEGSDSLTGSGSSEVGGVSMGESGTIFVYDGSPGGSGLSKLLFDRLDEAFDRTLSILTDCKCTSEDGCPLCTYSYQCGNNNEPLNKRGARESLEILLSGRQKTGTVKDSDYIGNKPFL